MDALDDLWKLKKSLNLEISNDDRLQRVLFLLSE